MTIFIRISPLVVAIVLVALIFGNMGGISVAIAAVGIGVAVAVPGAVAGAFLLLWRRLGREIPSPQGFVPNVIRVSPEPGELPGHARMLGPPEWRIPDDQIERIVEETLRRSQRPEQ